MYHSFILHIAFRKSAWAYLRPGLVWSGPGFGPMRALVARASQKKPKKNPYLRLGLDDE